MGIAGILEKIGSIFTRKKIGPDDEGLKIAHSVQHLLSKGVLNIVDEKVMGINMQESNPLENEKLERIASSFDLSPEKRQFLEFILTSINTNNEQFLRNLFLDAADNEWSEKSIKQMISTWPSVINDFANMGSVMPKETKAAVIMKKFEITKEEAAFLSKKQEVYRRWKDALRDGAKKRLGGKK
jgi:hypothetical protein